MVNIFQLAAYTLVLALCAAATSPRSQGPYFPKFHPRPKIGHHNVSLMHVFAVCFRSKSLILQDPNGPFFFNGVYHLFLQYSCNDGYTPAANPADGPIDCTKFGFPEGMRPGWGGIGWAHLTSKDLAHWEEQSPALVPPWIDIQANRTQQENYGDDVILVGVTVATPCC